MDIIVIYSAPDQSRIHQEVVEEIGEARSLAQQMRGLLISKVAGEPLRVETFLNASNKRR